MVKRYDLRDYARIYKFYEQYPIDYGYVPMSLEDYNQELEEKKKREEKVKEAR